ncbi:hypothetical protein H2204_014087 [Knufia peltigerae]|uniref:Uncharacterized protein n=1 Tax=Knufia peltigerae TaxID=1002370 RepID=A0AA38XM84_9EURO|nr:hypothetical protein H2204_014087 [Knufia peltigerae]
MSEESWVITSTKRKAKSVTPAPRKRPRCHDIETIGIRNTTSQQTLTQVQWVTPVSTSFEQDDSLQEMPLARTARARKPKKRNSTLTQMDFFSFPPPDHDDFDDEMMLPNQQHELTLPQFDGPYESPRRPRKRKPHQPTTTRSAKRKSTAPTLHSQEYIPSRKRGNQPGVENGQSVTPRRVSSRIASKQGLPSDAAENLEYFQRALGVPEDSRKDPIIRTTPCSLEIKESVDEGEVITNDTKTGQTQALRTPKKSRTVILSSQSPESLPPSTRRSTTNTSSIIGRQSLRTPLAERSLNSLLSPSRGLTGKLLDTAKHSPGKRKVVVLKLPKRKPAQSSARIDDSEAGLWSIPSSSPQLRQPQVDDPQEEQSTTPSLSEVENRNIEPEIPATSQAHAILSSPPDALTQDSLPDLADIVGRRGPIRDEAQTISPLQAAKISEESPTLVRDFAIAPTRTGRETSKLKSAIDSDIQNDGTLNEGADASGGDLHADEVVFGSPIANDTQFNINLEDRICSPSRQSRTPVGFAETRGMTLSNSSPTPRGRSSIHSTKIQSQDDELPPQTPLPYPTLVESPYKRTPEVQGNHEEGNKEVNLPTPALMHHSSTVVSTTKVPLNDTLQHSSSSPLWSARAITQKSIHPASIPHPSQMSTQEATQASPNMFSYPQRHETDITQRPDQFTIKDSSSFRVPLSQLPQHVGKSQSQYHTGSGINEVFDSEDEEDLDLDPSSLPSPPKKTATGDQGSVPRQGRIDTLEEDNYNNHTGSQNVSQKQDLGVADTTPIRSSQAISIPSSPSPIPLQRKYSPIVDFNNDTQSNFTQNGHVTAAYIHRQREAGNIPKWYVPQPYQVPGYTRRE